MQQKDLWDKANIILKAAIPFAVALSVFWWNSERTSAETSARMTEIAVGVLGEAPDGSGNDPLREWAIEVLMSPGNPPQLSQEAADALRYRRLRPAATSSLFNELEDSGRLSELMQNLKALEANLEQ